MEHRRERSEISVLKAELERQRLQNRDLEEENRNLKKREEKAAWDRSEIERKQVARNADLERVREARDQEIQHRKNSDTRLLESERKLADQEKAFRKVKDNLNHRLAAAQDKEREMATTIRRLERIEADLHKRLEEEQEKVEKLENELLEDTHKDVLEYSAIWDDIKKYRAELKEVEREMLIRRKSTRNRLQN